MYLDIISKPPTAHFISNWSMHRFEREKNLVIQMNEAELRITQLVY
jgi:hypothetical protein